MGKVFDLFSWLVRGSRWLIFGEFSSNCVCEFFAVCVRRVDEANFLFLLVAKAEVSLGVLGIVFRSSHTNNIRISNSFWAVQLILEPNEG